MTNNISLELDKILREIVQRLTKTDTRLAKIETYDRPVISGGGGTPGAPNNLSYLTVNAEANLTAERQIVIAGGATPTDGGANSTYTITVHATATEGPGIDLVTQQIGLGGDSTLLYATGGNPVAEFPATDAGLTLALAAAASGDIVTLPAYTIAGDHVIPAGVHLVGLSRYGTLLTGQVTGSAGASLENCSITRTANDANALYGVVAPATGTFYLSRVHVSVAQAGAGNAAAIYSNAGGDVEAWNCSLVAPAGGAGWHYGVYLDAGGNLVYVEAGVCIGSTGATNWSP